MMTSRRRKEEFMIAVIRGVESRGGPKGCRPKRGPGLKMSNFSNKMYKYLHYLSKILGGQTKILGGRRW